MCVLCYLRNVCVVYPQPFSQQFGRQRFKALGCAHDTGVCVVVCVCVCVYEYVSVCVLCYLRYVCVVYPQPFSQQFGRQRFKALGCAYDTGMCVWVCVYVSACVCALLFTECVCSVPSALQSAVWPPKVQSARLRL